MWVQAGFGPDEFWHQTPATFQACMDGVRKRIEREYERDTALAWQTANFNAATKSKMGLKPLKHFLPKPRTKQGSGEMLANMKMIAAQVNKVNQAEG